MSKKFIKCIAASLCLIIAVQPCLAVSSEVTNSVKSEKLKKDTIIGILSAGSASVFAAIMYAIWLKVKPEQSTSPSQSLNEDDFSKKALEEESNSPTIDSDNTNQSSLPQKAVPQEVSTPETLSEEPVSVIESSGNTNQSYLPKEDVSQEISIPETPVDISISSPILQPQIPINASNNSEEPVNITQSPLSEEDVSQEVPTPKTTETASSDSIQTQPQIPINASNNSEEPVNITQSPLPEEAVPQEISIPKTTETVSNDSIQTQPQIPINTSNNSEEPVNTTQSYLPKEDVSQEISIPKTTETASSDSIQTQPQILITDSNNSEDQVSVKDQSDNTNPLSLGSKFETTAASLNNYVTNFKTYYPSAPSKPVAYYDPRCLLSKSWAFPEDLNELSIKFSDCEILFEQNLKLPQNQGQSLIDLGEIKGETIIVGDLHSNLNSCKVILNRFLENITPDSRIIFLGDYTDRGGEWHDLLALLIKIQNELPDNIFLLSGNHETDPYGSLHCYNSKNMVDSLPDSPFFNEDLVCLTRFPICAKFKVHGKTYLCLHGAPSPQMLDAGENFETYLSKIQWDPLGTNNSLDDRDFNKFDPVNAITWAQRDTRNSSTCCMSNTGRINIPTESFVDFETKNGIDCIVSGHIHDTTTYYDKNKQLRHITLLSSANYCSNKNSGAALILTPDGARNLFVVHPDTTTNTIEIENENGPIDLTKLQLCGCGDFKYPSPQNSEAVNKLYAKS